MKNIKILFLLALTPFLVSCTKVISNPDVQTLNQKAVELMNSGDVKGAISRLESINDLNPDFPQNHYNLGVAYYKNEEYEKSIDSLKQAISLDKNLVDAYYTIGLAYQDIAGKEIEKLNKPVGEKQVNNKIEDSNKPEEKQLTKKEILALVVEDLKNSKEYYTQYTDLASNPAEKEKISQELQNIDLDIKKYEDQLSASEK
ncbi:MAG: tetratricopeptide repeat protein [bacterium]